MELFITENWDSLLSYFDAKDYDLYFKEKYVKLYEKFSEKGACCVAKEGNSLMLFPFLKRTFKYDNSVYYDFETAYGYGGPIFNVKNQLFQEKALKETFLYLKEQKYVCGFVRFHTLLRTYQVFDPNDVFFDRHTIAMDLTPPEDEIWSRQIHSKNRNVIRKAEKAGLTYIVDNKFEYLNDFIRLYNGTMDKLSADDFYYFDDNYYKRFIDDISNSFLGVVKLEEKVISAAIFMYEGIYGHYHLSGSDKQYLNYSPNNFMLYQTALEMKRRGVELFHLGGGTTSLEDDSLFCFKKKFSPLLFDFYIGKFIFNKDIYKRICEKWEKENPEKALRYKNRLLKYKY